MFTLIEMSFTCCICPIIIGPLKNFLVSNCSLRKKTQAIFQSINGKIYISLTIYNTINYYLLVYKILGYYNNSRLVGIQLALENGPQIQSLEPCHNIANTSLFLSPLPN